MGATTAHKAPGTAVEAVAARAFEIPTATDEESDGTLTWTSTTLVVAEVQADGVTGLGFTYSHPAAAQVITSKLAGAVKGADALMPEHAWAPPTRAAPWRRWCTWSTPLTTTASRACCWRAR